MAKPCIITYEGKKYDYPTFAAMLHDGLLADLISQGVINDKSFVEEQEQLQKPKKYKELDELSQSELQRKITKTFEGFREDVLKRDLADIRNTIIQAKEGIPILLQAIKRHVTSYSTNKRRLHTSL